MSVSRLQAPGNKAAANYKAKLRVPHCEGGVGCVNRGPPREGRGDRHTHVLTHTHTHRLRHREQHREREIQRDTER